MPLRGAALVPLWFLGPARLVVWASGPWQLPERPAPMPPHGPLRRVLPCLHQPPVLVAQLLVALLIVALFPVPRDPRPLPLALHARPRTPAAPLVARPVALGGGGPVEVPRQPFVPPVAALLLAVAVLGLLEPLIGTPAVPAHATAVTLVGEHLR